MIDYFLYFKNYYGLSLGVRIFFYLASIGLIEGSKKEGIY